MRFKILFIPFFIFFSCSLKPKNYYHYSDGKAVTDSVHLAFISQELKQLTSLKGDELSGLKVYTSLENTRINKQIDLLIPSLADSIFESIRWSNETDRKFADSLKKIGKFLSAGVIVTDNKTGQIVNAYSNYTRGEINCVTLKHETGSLGKPLLFCLAMKKEFKPEDRYPQLTMNSEKSVDDLVNKRFYEAMNGFTGATITQGLGLRYTLDEQRNFLRSLELDQENLQQHPMFIDCQLSLADIGYFFQGIENNGNFRKPSVIDSIADASGKTIYRKKNSSKKLLDSETADEMNSLLSHYKHSGYGKLVCEKYPGSPDFTGFFGTNANGRQNCLVAVERDFTTVILLRHSGRFLTKKNGEWGESRGRIVPLWIELNKMLEPKYGKQPKCKSPIIKFVADPEIEL